MKGSAAPRDGMDGAPWRTSVSWAERESDLCLLMPPSIRTPIVRRRTQMAVPPVIPWPPVAAEITGFRQVARA